MSTKPTTTDLEWTELDQRAVDTARVLAADAVQKVGNGHPGTAMSLAPAAYTLFQKVMRHDPADPEWVGRDRFVLSAGHSSLTLYTQLYLAGFGLELDDLKAFRTWGSKTPGHPEYGHTKGVETTTGPLGQGVANAVGMAMAARYERGLFDPDAPAGESPFDHFVYCIAGDGCLQEGIAAEASSLAGHQKLGNLVLLWDDNHISIEGDTETAVSEDTVKRYEAYGWHVQRVEAQENGDLDPAAIYAAIQEAKRVTDRPSFIAMRSIIAWPAPNAQNTEAAHGSALGDEEVAATKRVLGFDPEKSFEVADEVITHTRKALERGAQAKAEWEKSLQEWRDANPERAAEFDRIAKGELPAGWEEKLPVFEPGKAVATRAASGKVLQALGAVIPELWGGSADLAGSNNTTIDKDSSFLPAGNPLPEANPYGRTIHFGIREHSMGAEINGIALHGNTRIYGGTFLVFSDYMRNAVRLSALMHLPVTYVWTHDSIGLGEDGPTHQPVEHLASLRAIPAARPGAHPPGRADVRAERRRGQGRLRPVRGRRRRAAGHPDRHRFRGARGRRGARAAPGRGRAHPCGVDAVRGVVRAAGPGVPGLRAAAVRQGPCRRGGGHRPDLAQVRGGRRPHRFPGALRCFRRRQAALPRIRLHRGERGRQGAGIPRRRPALTPIYDT